MQFSASHFRKTRHINLLPLARINFVQKANSVAPARHGEVEVLSRMFLVIISKCKTNLYTNVRGRSAAKKFGIKLLILILYKRQMFFARTVIEQGFKNRLYKKIGSSAAIKFGVRLLISDTI